MTATSNTGETLQSIVIKSAAYCKKEKSPQHEFIWIQFENTALPNIWNYMVLDRNKFGGEPGPGGAIWPSIQESGSVVAQDEFRVSCDGNLSRLLKRCGLTPCKIIETITFDVGHFLPLYHFAAVAVATHELRNRYHLIQANCYWFAGIIWEYMIGNCPNIKHVVRAGTRGKFGVLFSHTTDSSELEEVRIRVQELLSGGILDGAFDALFKPGELLMRILVGASGEPNGKDLAAKNARRRAFEASIQQMPSRTLMDYLRNLTDLAGEINTNRTQYLDGQTKLDRSNSRPSSAMEPESHEDTYDKLFFLGEADMIPSKDCREDVPPGTAITTDEPRIAGGHQAQSSTSSCWSVKESNTRWSTTSGSGSSSDVHSRQRWSNSRDEPDGLLEVDKSLSEHNCEDCTTPDKGRELIVDAKGRPVSQLDVPTGTTHLLLGSSAIGSVIPSFLAQIFPQISSTLLCLNISNNELTTLPTALTSCIQLEELNVSHNPLRTLPSTLSALISLRMLIADGCKIQGLPSQLVQLGALHSLSVRSNRLVMLPVWIYAMPSLAVLKIEGNTFAGPWRNLVHPLLPRATTNGSQDWSSDETQRHADEEVACQRLALRAIGVYLRDVAYLQGGASIALTQSTNGEPQSDELYASNTHMVSVARSTPSMGRSKASWNKMNNTGGNSSVRLVAEDKRFEDNKSWRMAIIRAIIETEKSYVKGLQELLDIYVKPSSKPVAGLNLNKETIIPFEERKILFTGLGALLHFHKDNFLPSLISAAGIPPSAETGGDISTRVAHAVARVFVSEAASMKMYCTYTNNVDDAIQRSQFWNDLPSMPNPTGSNTPNTDGVVLSTTLTEVASGILNQPPTFNSRKRKRIKQFLQQCRLNPRHSQLTLEHYLLLPVQRIPTYMVLLDNLVTCTPQHPEAWDNTPRHALGEIVALTNSMNEGKRKRARLLQREKMLKEEMISIGFG